MAWKDNTAHIKIRRRYRCDVCEHVFDVRHEREDEPPPPCPACVAVGQTEGAPTYIPPMPALGTTKGKAIDLAQKMAEEDFGLTDFNDNQRVGDIAVKAAAPMQTAERDEAVRQMLAWQAAQDAQVAMPLPHEPVLADGSRAQVAEKDRNALVDPHLQAANYWQGNAGATDHTIGQAAVAKSASQAAAAEGLDPIGILERGRQSGSMPMRFNVMGREDSIPAELQQAQANRGAMP
jgi:hypothetical protein